MAPRDGLDALRETVREFAERASALDSAVWRTTSRGGARVEGGGRRTRSVSSIVA